MRSQRATIIMQNFAATILALSAIHPSAGFVAPTATSFKRWENAGATSSSFSYLAGLGVTGITGSTSALDTAASPYFITVKTDSPQMDCAVPVTSKSSPVSDDSYTNMLEARLADLESLQSQAGIQTSFRNVEEAQQFRDNSYTVQVPGGSRKTWSIASAAVDRVQIRLQTEGFPLDADIDLWQGPDNTPHKIRVYAEDGRARPLNCVMMTPRGSNTIAIRNEGPLEFPMAASVFPDAESAHLDIAPSDPSASQIIPGGAFRTYPFDNSVESVQILLQTDGRPVNAKIELLQGSNSNKKMVIEVYTEDGRDRPFYVVIETPGSGNVVRVVNTAIVEFPVTALVEPYLINNDRSAGVSEVVVGGDARSVLDRLIASGSKLWTK